MTLSPILPFNKLPGLKRDSTDENSLKDLKKASFTLLPDHPNAHTNLRHDTFDDILISRQKQYKDGKTEDLNREKMVQEARQQMEVLIKEHYQEKREKVGTELLYLEQYVKKYKDAIMNNIDFCMKESLDNLKQSDWNDITKLSLTTYRLNGSSMDQTKNIIKTIYEPDRIDLAKNSQRISDFDQNNTLNETIIDLLRDELTATNRPYKQSNTPMKSREDLNGGDTETLDLSMNTLMNSRRDIRPNLLRIIDGIKNVTLMPIKESSVRESFRNSVKGASELESPDVKKDIIGAFQGKHKETPIEGLN